MRSWVIEKICDFATELAKEVGERGDTYYWAHYNEDGKFFEFRDKDLKPVGLFTGVTNYYGSLELRKALCANGFKWDENFRQFDYSNVSSEFGPQRMLNEKFILLPYRSFWDDLYYPSSLFSVDSEVFIRPNSSEKLFTGRLFDFQEFSKPVEDFKELKLNDLLVFSSPKNITWEWRFLCYYKEIIDYSLYKLNGNITEINSAPTSAVELVNDVISHTPLDGYYTVDVAGLHNGKFKIIEANGCFTASLYACNPKKLLDHLDNTALINFL